MKIRLALTGNDTDRRCIVSEYKLTAHARVYMQAVAGSPESPSGWFIGINGNALRSLVGMQRILVFKRRTRGSRKGAKKS